MLDEDQVTALNLAKNGHNLLITGQATSPIAQKTTDLYIVFV
jgi:hypothetical protein